MKWHLRFDRGKWRLVWWLLIRFVELEKCLHVKLLRKIISGNKRMTAFLGSALRMRIGFKMRSNFQNNLNYLNSNGNVNQDNQCIRSMYYNHASCLMPPCLMLNVCCCFSMPYAMVET